MKLRLLFVILSAFFFLSENINAQSQESTTFILIRHAEKGKDDPRDPNLNEIGKERADRLLELLAYTKIDAIVSTPYKRTRQTVAPLADKKSLEVIDYNPRDGEVMNKLAKKYHGKTVVVSGHSNTTPHYVNQLASTEFKQLSEDEYDKVFIVTFSEVGVGKVIVLKY